MIVVFPRSCGSAPIKPCVQKPGLLVEITAGAGEEEEALAEARGVLSRCSLVGVSG